MAVPYFLFSFNPMEKITKLIEWMNLDFNSLTARVILTKAREIEAEKPVWTPTKGEEIEVSDDGIN